MGLNNGSSTEKPGPGSPSGVVWVFGYGSLLWKTNFPYTRKVIGHVKGYERRFWQASVTHRGTPEMPGRVATLVENDKGITWGLAYEVNPSDVPEVIAYLNKRESGGYTTQEVTFYPNDSMHSIKDPFTVLVYIATETNPNYLGPQTMESLATRIVKCRGVSGPNTEYLFELAKSMREIAPGVPDEHLYGLTEKVETLLKNDEKTQDV